MTFFHEIGHVICGFLSGGKLQSADLVPWRLPYSYFEPDPMPLVTLWGGPILGVLIPASIAGVVRKSWAWFVAYFCVLANGTYIALAWFSHERLLDTERLLDHGAHPISIVIYCGLTISIGYVGFRHECARLLVTPTGSPE